MSDHPVKDPIKGSPYEKAKLKAGDKEKIERRFRVTQIKHRRLDVDESVSPMRRLAKKLVEMVGHGNKG